jgi:sarcosine oxidase subunit alpha
MSLRFTFDGQAMQAEPGDTLAAALLRNGVRVVGRSFKYHRPRGMMAAGPEEPSALVTVGQGGRTEPNTRATDLFVYDGLDARSQNAWPSLRFDAGAVLGALAPVFAAGFYYKTFFGGPKLWLFYERFIRRAAGLGNAPAIADPEPFEHRAGFCGVAVIGSGPAGLAAAEAAAKSGERVWLIERDAVLGGRLLFDGDADAPARIAAARAAVEAAGGRVLTRTTASGLWDHGFLTLDQHLAEAGQPSALPQRLWHLRAGRIVLATGAMERPLTFAGNDRPGVMLSQAVRAYVRRFGVKPGRQAVVAINNDDGYRTALALADAGVAVIAVLDSRPAPGGALVEAARARLPVFTDARPLEALGGRAVHSLDAVIGAERRRFPCDLVALSGGFTPAIHLHSQGGGKLVWREDIQAFVAGETLQPLALVGSAAGEVESVAPSNAPLPDPKHSFIDFQNDVTAADIDLAWREGYRSVEHLKRYTTLGMATDQGKTSNMAALARLAAAAGVEIPAAGLTTFRPPYTPMTLGTIAGPDAGGHAAPNRRLALFDRHQRHNPLWQPLGYWHRPRAYPRVEESLHQAAMREAKTVRKAVGLVDVSTLAKFAVQGPDAARLLEIVCATGVARLAVGRGRYTFMLREDGMLMDDGTVWRTGETSYLLTSSTGGADRMIGHLAYVRDVLAPGLKVSVVNQQEHYAGMALAGPKAKAILASLTGAEPPAHMGLAEGTIAATPVLVLAASYSGERAFEIYADAHRAGPVWDALELAVDAAGGCLYGLEALEFLRIEKGHVVVGGEADGRRTAADLGMGGMQRKAGGFVGASALARPALAAEDRLQLVGLTAATAIPEGAMLVRQTGAPVEGHVTSAGPRVLEPGAVALALLAGGRARHGETLVATSPTRGQHVPVTVTAPIFYNAEGGRYRD